MCPASHHQQLWDNIVGCLLYVSVGKHHQRWFSSIEVFSIVASSMPMIVSITRHFHLIVPVEHCVVTLFAALVSDVTTHVVAKRLGSHARVMSRFARPRAVQCTADQTPRPPSLELASDRESTDPATCVCMHAQLCRSQLNAARCAAVAR